MRDMLAHADLDRYAGQLVWLELNFDNENSRTFLDEYGAVGTPTFYVIDPQDGQVTAAQTGAMSLEELKAFIDRGVSGVSMKRLPLADAALARGDALLAQRPPEAVAAYRQALKSAPSGWPRSELAQASLVTALRSSQQYRECSQTAALGAATMKRDSTFARTVVTGMWCLVSPQPAPPWQTQEAAKLEPLAKEALSLTTTIRDHRDELYRTFMMLSLARQDKTTAQMWGDRWLAELDAIHPRNDEERTALDIARVENIEVYGDPKRILPALSASELAMPGSWNASLRVAQMEYDAKHYEAAITACDRGLRRGPGPFGQSWLLQTKASALEKTGQIAGARRALEDALIAAQRIPLGRTRDSNLNRIHDALAK